MHWRPLTATKLLIALMASLTAIHLFSQVDRQLKTHYAATRAELLNKTWVLYCSTPQQIESLALKINELPYGPSTLEAVQTFFQTWATIDRKAALAAVTRQRDAGVRDTAARAVVQSSSPSLCGELAVWLRDQSDAELLSKNKKELLDVLLPKWALADAPAAAKFFDELDEAQKKALSYETDNNIGRAWATVDPHKALAWADKHTYPTSNGQDMLWSETISGWATTDMTAAANYLAQHMDRQGAKEAADAVVAAMLRADSSGNKAVTWLRNLPSNLRKWEVEGNFAYIWARDDPQACARWVETLPPDEQPATVGGLMLAWPGTNWPAASTWIASVNGRLRDEAIASAVNTGFQRVPAKEAISLATSITDNTLRHRAISDAVVHWALEDRKAAIAWVKGSSLSAEEKREILSLDVLSRW